jgi:hypothetical protein
LLNCRCLVEERREGFRCRLCRDAGARQEAEGITAYRHLGRQQTHNDSSKATQLKDVEAGKERMWLWKRGRTKTSDHREGLCATFPIRKLRSFAIERGCMLYAVCCMYAFFSLGAAFPFRKSLGKAVDCGQCALTTFLSDGFAYAPIGSKLIRTQTASLGNAKPIHRSQRTVQSDGNLRNSALTGWLAWEKIYKRRASPSSSPILTFSTRPPLGQSKPATTFLAHHSIQ